MAKTKKKKKVLSRTRARTREKKKPVSENKLDNTFRMVVLASKRAKEIFMGEKPLIETNEVHPCLIAIEEIKKGKVKVKEIK